MYPTIRPQLLEDELHFQACHDIRGRPGGNKRLGRYVEDGLPGQKRFSHAVHGLRKVRAEKVRSRSITKTCSASQPPGDNHRTHDPYDMIVLARNITLFTVAFSTTKREDGLSRTLIQHILRLPNECCFLLIYNGGRRCETTPTTTCPVGAVE